VNVLGTSIFTTYLLPFEITSALLVIAIIGAVVLARRPQRLGEPPEPVGDDATGDAGAQLDAAQLDAAQLDAAEIEDERSLS
jgi:hypothetical protein